MSLKKTGIARGNSSEHKEKSYTKTQKVDFWGFNPLALSCEAAVYHSAAQTKSSLTIILTMGHIQHPRGVCHNNGDWSLHITNINWDCRHRSTSWVCPTNFLLSYKKRWLLSDWCSLLAKYPLPDSWGGSWTGGLGCCCFPPLQRS